MRGTIRLRDLRRIGLDAETMDDGTVALTCRECGDVWFVDHGRRRGWRICPTGCNDPARDEHDLGAVARGDTLAGRQHGVPGAPEVQVGGLTPVRKSVRAPKLGSGQAPAYRADGTTRAGGSHP